ncbi:hypothetical protein E2562_020354 [Oryza meyeriana var. granulata]|uniref:DUF834 domain-containing protein n=1 Tax=Oryza meyeriana var. granulata TaxID=110450 RepID=A0A6G1DKN9_9ORYZ|nr:hypothetical protein E2562_020354 [Oryza meyeriana var. granulata]
METTTRWWSVGNSKRGGGIVEARQNGGRRQWGSRSASGVERMPRVEADGGSWLGVRRNRRQGKERGGDVEEAGRAWRLLVAAGSASMESETRRRAQRSTTMGIELGGQHGADTVHKGWWRSKNLLKLQLVKQWGKEEIGD